MILAEMHLVEVPFGREGSWREGAVCEEMVQEEMVKWLNDRPKPTSNHTIIDPGLRALRGAYSQPGTLRTVLEFGSRKTPEPAPAQHILGWGYRRKSWV